LVLVEEPTEQVSSMHAASAILAERGQPGGWTWWLQSKCPVRTVPVVVLEIDPEDLLQVTTSDDQQPVQALGADRPNPPLRVGVGVRRLDRRYEHLGTLDADHVVEPTTELRVPVADEEAHLLAPLAQHQE
jgi:hypothetical protein